MRQNIFVTDRQYGQVRQSSETLIRIVAERDTTPRPAACRLIVSFNRLETERLVQSYRLSVSSIILQITQNTNLRVSRRKLGNAAPRLDTLSMKTVLRSWVKIIVFICMYIYINICIYIYMCVNVYIYMYIQREREREREKYLYI